MDHFLCEESLPLEKEQTLAKMDTKNRPNWRNKNTPTFWRDFFFFVDQELAISPESPAERWSWSSEREFTGPILHNEETSKIQAAFADNFVETGDISRLLLTKPQTRKEDSCSSGSHGLRDNEYLVRGTYVHPSIAVGFCYKVRPIGNKKFLFQGKALRLEGIGKGYGKRITFESESFVRRDNFFWSDTNPEGFGFSIEAIDPRDELILLSRGTPAGNVKFISDEKPQKELESYISGAGIIEKRITVSLLCNIQYYDDPSEAQNTIRINGVAKLISNRGNKNSVTRGVDECLVDGNPGYELVYELKIQKTLCMEVAPYIHHAYEIQGLSKHEQPVIGTYVDQRIVPGFCYKVRPANSKRHFFSGEAKLLQSIGKGYGKRITFKGGSLKENDNYFWSDSERSGYAFSIQAVSVGDKFIIIDKNENEIGTTEIFCSDAPQTELRSWTDDGVYKKEVQVTLSCHLNLNHFVFTTIVKGKAILANRGQSVLVEEIKDLTLEYKGNIEERSVSANISCFVRSI